jgi:hypothetical protein
MLGLQYAFTPSDTLDVTYIGNKGVDLVYNTINTNTLSASNQALGSSLFNQVTNPFYGSIATSGCGLNNPTITRQQSLKPYPEYCSVNEIQRPGGDSWYHAVSLNYNHRWSQGLHMLVSFTVSKYIDMSSGPDNWLTPEPVGMQNLRNLSAEKSLDSGDIPKSLVISYVYELPVGRGRKWGGNMNKLADSVVGGWQLSGITTFKDGFPLSFLNALNNSNAGGGGQRPNIVGDPHISNPSPAEWFNTAAFAQPAAFTFGDAPRTMPDLRAPGLNNWDLTVQKNWHWQEKLRIQFRAEFYNAFNTTYFHAPDSTYGSATFGQINVSGFARAIQAGLKINW